MIYDSEGRPTEPTLKDVTIAFGKDLEQISQILQVLQNSIMLVEMKANFVISQLQEKGVLETEINDAWAQFVRKEQARMQEDNEEVVQLTPRDSNPIIEL